MPKPKSQPAVEPDQMRRAPEVDVLADRPVAQLVQHRAADGEQEPEAGEAEGAAGRAIGAFGYRSWDAHRDARRAGALDPGNIMTMMVTRR